MTTPASGPPAAGSSQRPFFAAAPQLSMPKGGGAIRGIGEKFTANPVTGTASFTIPIATSPGRNGFGPQLALAYDSGSGNGPYGFGWNLSVPSISRKTDKGLPRYGDSDVYIMSGAEDLVQQRGPDGIPVTDTATAPGYTIYRYRPRVEASFTRIEQWVRDDDADTHWRSFTRDNVLTVYGRDERSRIADGPADEAGTSPRVFSWLISETRDDRGNAIVYDYKPEDGALAPLDAPHQRNRGDADDTRRRTNRYLKKIRYGNRIPFLDPVTAARPVQLTDIQIADAAWMFELILDYGEHDPITPTPREQLPWNHRGDAFSSYRPGFEVRTARRCARFLMFHHFALESNVGQDCLVRSTELAYSSGPNGYSLLDSVTHSGYVRSGTGYVKRSMPPVELDYSQAHIEDELHEVDPAMLANLPCGINGRDYALVDLHGEGIAGALSRDSGAWIYQRNVSPLNGRSLQFTPPEYVAELPTGSGPRAQLMDLAGDGTLDLVDFDDPTPGFYEHDAAEGWEPFQPFRSRVTRDVLDPNARFIDLDGDGCADLVVTEDFTEFIWYPSMGEQGFAPARSAAQGLDEETGPRVIFADGTDTIHVADMSGDGLVDLVRIRNNEICYWPNLGYGRFGAKVAMDRDHSAEGMPGFDVDDQFDPRRIRLADIDGSGTTDIIYLGSDRVQLYFNESGNAMSAPMTLTAFPPLDDLSAITVADLLGDGTACLAWSSPLPGNRGRQLRYVRLMGEGKPHLLTSIANNLGTRISLTYTSSVKLYLDDKHVGRKWLCPLPFPVHVLERVETHDVISGNRFTTRYIYHDGYYDGAEREFRGFGMVEQIDGVATEHEADRTHAPAKVVRTWYHTGVHHTEADLLEMRYSTTCWPEEPHLRLQASARPAGDVTADEMREACRSLKGSILRQEVFAEDGSMPYTVTQRNYRVEVVQRRHSDSHAVCFARPSETLNLHYERTEYPSGDGVITDPRVTHEMVLKCDDFGNVLLGATIGYPRSHPEAGDDERLDAATRAAIRTSQTTLMVTATASTFTNVVDLGTDFRLPSPAEVQTYELTGIAADAGHLLTVEAVLNDFGVAAAIPYEAVAPAGLSRRLVDHTRLHYRSDDMTRPLPIGEQQAKGLTHESYRLAFTPGVLAGVYTRDGEALIPDADALLGSEGGYVRIDGNWWIPSGRLHFSPGPSDSGTQELAHAAAHFYSVCRLVDQFGEVAIARYDAYDLLLLDTVDQAGLRTSAGERAPAPTTAAEALTPRLDYRVLAPTMTSDANRNRTEVLYDALGLVTATARRGKPEEALGDTLADVDPDVDPTAYFDDPAGRGPTALGAATTRFVIDVGAFHRTRDKPAPTPVAMALLHRESHQTVASRIQHKITYSDGMGREVQVKAQCEPDSAGPRWVGTGWTEFNQQGLPERKYEPFFSTTHRFEQARTVGTSNFLAYDPLGREVAMLTPDGSYTKTIFDPWEHRTWDANDTTLLDPRTDDDVAGLFAGFFANQPATWRTWFQQRSDGSLGPREQRAAEEASGHAATPGRGYADVLGRVVVTVAHLRSRGLGDGDLLEEFHPVVDTVDIEGARLRTTDARGVDTLTTRFDVAGRAIATRSPDSGRHWFVPDVNGIPIRRFDATGLVSRHVYDSARRPTQLWISPAEGTTPFLASLTVYGDRDPVGAADNLRGRARFSFDESGVLVAKKYDFKGNLLTARRRLAKSFRSHPDWAVLASVADDQIEETALPLLEVDEHETASDYDALDRPVNQRMPDGTVLVSRYNEAGLLESLSARLPGSALETPFLTAAEYDANGSRRRADFANGVSTFHHIDPLTFRVRNITTTRTAGGDLQNLSFVYDPSGNLVDIADAAQQSIFFAGRVTNGDSRYVFDSLYRLVEATGREHASLGVQPDHTGTPHKPIPHPNDGQAVRGYVERYSYDPAGNITAMSHLAGPTASWTRRYDYASDSNQLTSHTISGGPDVSFSHDVHGNMVGLPHLGALSYDHDDQMVSVDLRGGGQAFYTYDGAGNRRRRVIERAGAVTEEFIYLPSYDIYRKRVNGVVTFERQTVHLMDGQRRVALLETVTVDTGGLEGVGTRRHRYQIEDQLISARLEVTEDGAIISAEEYHPYGTTALWLGTNAVEASPKRYRYTGKERDDETSLYYCGARYYIPWLGRWASCDPQQHRPGESTYMYVRGNPIRFIDPNGADCKEAHDQKVPWLSFLLPAHAGYAVRPQVNPCLADHPAWQAWNAEEQRNSTNAALAGTRVGHGVGLAPVAALGAGVLLTLGAIPLGALAMSGAESAAFWAMANPGRAAVLNVLGQFGIGLIDPHPPGASPLDADPLIGMGHLAGAEVRSLAQVASAEEVVKISTRSLNPRQLLAAIREAWALDKQGFFGIFFRGVVLEGALAGTRYRLLEWVGRLKGGFFKTFDFYARESKLGIQLKTLNGVPRVSSYKGFIDELAAAKKAGMMEDGRQLANVRLDVATPENFVGPADRTADYVKALQEIKAYAESQGVGFNVFGVTEKELNQLLVAP
ncbi:SpvB/TcaC N-terminal domain-containing protein [Nocardia amamiensis]|uniref:SpvB/TcaC N-terminal domain-containing protein n=1 Tax=Nocardia amamiensis TaxID=404578 RepID=UPI0033F28FDA